MQPSLIDHPSDKKGEEFLTKRLTYLLALGFGLLAIVALLLFGTISTDLRCVRSSSGVECKLTRYSSLIKMHEIKISDPLAVDVTEHRNRGAPPSSYTAEIRTSNISLSLLSDYRYEIVQSAANEVNEFLLSSNQPVLFKRFP